MRNGFTLIESLIVLFVISLFTFLPGLLLENYRQHLEERQFFAELEQRIILTQQLAVTNQVSTKIKSAGNKQEVHFSTQLVSGETSQDWWILPVPEGIEVISESMISFQKETGKNEGKLGLLHFKVGERKVKYQFQMGYNRFEKSCT